jgi:uncharacterized protein (TIGR02118 family)
LEQQGTKEFIMVYRAISTWSAPKPEDVQKFEEYYHKVHVPFAARVPGALKLILNRTSDGFETTPSAFYRVAEMWFEDRAAFEKATTTKEWNEMRQDGMYVHEHFGVSLLSGLGDIEDVPLKPSGPRPAGSRAGK